MLEIVPVGEIHNDDQITMLTGAIVFIVSSLIGMLWLMVRTLAHSREAAEKASGAYAAVNGVGQGDHRLYDRVGHIAADVEHLVEVNNRFQAKGFAGMSSDLATGPALEHTIREIQQGTIDAATRLDEIQVELLAHIKRERTRDGVPE